MYASKLRTAYSFFQTSICKLLPPKITPMQTLILSRRRPWRCFNSTHCCHDEGTFDNWFSHLHLNKGHHEHMRHVVREMRCELGESPVKKSDEEPLKNHLGLHAMQNCRNKNSNNYQKVIDHLLRNMVKLCKLVSARRKILCKSFELYGNGMIVAVVATQLFYGLIQLFYGLGTSNSLY